MHDTLDYFSHDPIFSPVPSQFSDLSGLCCYSFHETFVLPLSHDDGRSMQRVAINHTCDELAEGRHLRLAGFAYMFARAGKDLLFTMGAPRGGKKKKSLANTRVVSLRSLDGTLLSARCHRGLLSWMDNSNRAMRGESASHGLTRSVRDSMGPTARRSRERDPILRKSSRK